MLRTLVRIVLALMVFTVPAIAAELTLTGTVTYRERIALPQGAVLRVTLVDTEAGNALVSAATAIPNQSPIGFSLNVHRTLPADRSYGLTAEITADGRVMFRSREAVPVDLLAPVPVGILVQHVPEPRPDPAPTPPLPPQELVDVVWTVTSIGGRPVSGSRPLTLSIAPDYRVGGSGGCNNYFTEASIEGDAIGFGPAAATRMACAESVMAQEATYFTALAAVTKFELDGTSLRLLDAAGIPLIGLVNRPE